MGREHDAAQCVISQCRYLSLCSSNAQMAVSWRIGLFAIFAATLNQPAVLQLFLSLCVGLIPRKIKSTQKDEAPETDLPTDSGASDTYALRAPDLDRYEML